MARITDTSRLDDCEIAHTVQGVRQLLRRATRVSVRVAVSADDHVDVRASKAAILDSLREWSADDVVGAMLYSDGSMVVCIGARFAPHDAVTPLTWHDSKALVHTLDCEDEG